MSTQLARWRQGAEEAARLGAGILEQWRSKFSVREKGRADLVTEADLASQKAIQAFLKERFPDHDFLGEEDPGAKEGRGPAIDAPPTWIVDPLDGTSNYVHDVPAYCVSIGLMVAGELVVGVIYDPRLNELFSAATGLGATLNGKPIAVSETHLMANAMMSTGFPPDPDKQERNLLWWKKFTYQAQALRRTGSTALNMAYVSCGRFDAYWAFDNFAWDVAAGVVLVREAGGLVSRISGDKCDPFQQDLVCANPTLHGLLIDSLANPDAE
jgi:myo-inositol-1(or 4)-monophosphatase